MRRLVSGKVTYTTVGEQGGDLFAVDFDLKFDRGTFVGSAAAKLNVNVVVEQPSQ